MMVGSLLPPQNCSTVAGWQRIVDHYLRSARVVQAHRRFSVPASFCSSWTAALSCSTIRD
ncbi:unnamed protein product [Arabidopsis lyrata]|nr:unnamed protein product [Arabidopsis lyrata]